VSRRSRALCGDSMRRNTPASAWLRLAAPSTATGPLLGLGGTYGTNGRNGIYLALSTFGRKGNDMAQYEELIAVSIKERQHAIRLATADLDRLRDQLTSTEAVLRKLGPNSERSDLLQRVRARLAEVVALRRERVTQVATKLIANGAVTVSKYHGSGTALLAPLSQAVASSSANSYLLMVSRILGIDSPAFAAQSTARKANHWPVLVRTMCVARYFATLYRRACGSRRGRSMGGCPDQPPEQSVTRSAAAQSRIVAPIGAPPAFC